MKLPASYFENLSNSKYRQYLKLLPDMRQENTRLITTLILTFAALSFFSIFAINPTLTTIVELKKEVADNEFTNQQLSTKLSNLSILQQKYTALGPDLQLIDNAIPQSANAAQLTGQIHALTRDANLQLRNLRVSQVQLTGGKASANGLSYVFSLEAEGTYENMMRFAANSTNFDRIVTVEAISIGKDPRTSALVLSMRGRQYFKP